MAHPLKQTLRLTRPGRGRGRAGLGGWAGLADSPDPPLKKCGMARTGRVRRARQGPLPGHVGSRKIAPYPVTGHTNTELQKQTVS